MRHPREGKDAGLGRARSRLHLSPTRIIIACMNDESNREGWVTRPATAVTGKRRWRDLFLAGLEGAAASAGYFLLDDFVRPPLVVRHLAGLWWLTLGLYLVLLFAFGFRPVWRARPGFVAMGCLLFGAAVYSFDSTIQPHLASIGLGWLWMVSIGGFFVWLIVFAVRFRKRPNQKSN
jgi:hypothetical protein